MDRGGLVSGSDLGHLSQHGIRPEMSQGMIAESAILDVELPYEGQVLKLHLIVLLSSLRTHLC